MKTVLASGVSLLVGLAIGWYIEHRRAEHEKTEIVQEMVSGMESADGVQAGRAVRAIQMIDAGEAPEAVRLLSSPIAHFYSLYSECTRNDERTTRTLTLIEQLARTNRAVAARIAEDQTNYRAKKP